MLPGPDDRTVLVDPSGAEVTVADIKERARRFRAASDRQLTFLDASPTLDAVTDFLALLESGRAVFLMDPAWTEDQRERLIDLYRPGVAHPDLAVLLTTSGSTGSPRLVRLSRQNIEINARQIAQTLGLRPDDRGVTVLPLHYAFGLSVVTSHVLAGSSVLVTDRGLLDREFWEDLSRAGVTFLPGVPQSYEMLRRLGLRDRAPSLRALIQAGGRLAAELVSEFADIMAQRDGQFFVMYGQTEASPRMACLPPHRLGDKVGSVGRAMPGGRFVIDDGEVVYTGPNVMMGYADSAADLRLPDTHGDTLRTGDLGYLDDEGFLFLTGRLKRIVKLAGNRVALDEIEALVPQVAPAVAVDAGERVVLFTESTVDLTPVRRELARTLRVAAKLVDVRRIDTLPLLSSGKIDYARLTEEARSAQ